MSAGALPDCEMFLRCYNTLCKACILDTEINKKFKIELCIGRKQIFENTIIKKLKIIGWLGNCLGLSSSMICKKLIRLKKKVG